MRNYSILTLLVLFLSAISCTKVADLSDEAKIESFKILTSTPDIQLGQEEINRNTQTITIPVNFGRKHFPLEITTTVKLSETTEDVISSDEIPVNLKKFTFNDVYTPQTFYLIAESGVPHLWSVRLKDIRNAEIDSFTVPSIPKDNITIWNNNIRISLPGNPQWPVTITPSILKTDDATYKNYREGNSFTFTSYNDIKQIVLEAVNGDERVWNIQITPFIENSDFERWINMSSPTKINIDPTPGKGLGWSTANNSYVRGTTPVKYGKGYAAHLETSVQDLGFLGLGQLITAGSIFTGYFSLNLQLDNPRSMTYFSIPFSTRPKSISVEARYAPGEILQRSVKGKKGYELVKQSGMDKGHIWVELLHWQGSGDLKYHAAEAPEGLTILGRGEYILESATSWKSLEIPIKYHAAEASKMPTHIAIVMTSSKDGDLFLGAIGSVLEVDNVTVNY